MVAARSGYKPTKTKEHRRIQIPRSEEDLTLCARERRGTAGLESDSHQHLRAFKFKKKKDGAVGSEINGGDRSALEAVRMSPALRTTRSKSDGGG